MKLCETRLFQVYNNTNKKASLLLTIKKIFVWNGL